MAFVLIFLAVTALGGLLGIVVGWLTGLRWAARKASWAEALDADVEAQIEAAARRWATARDRPWAAPLVADKLRTAYRLRRPSPPDRWPS